MRQSGKQQAGVTKFIADPPLALGQIDARLRQNLTIALPRSFLTRLPVHVAGVLVSSGKIRVSPDHCQRAGPTPARWRTNRRRAAYHVRRLVAPDANRAIRPGRTRLGRRAMMRGPKALDTGEP
jgi:hypothetical protein